MDTDRADQRRRQSWEVSAPRDAGFLACGARTSICVHLCKRQRRASVSICVSLSQTDLRLRL